MTANRAGDARQHKRIHRPATPFALATHLPADGAMPIGEAMDAAVFDWHRQALEGLVVAATVDTYEKALARLPGFLAACDAELVCDITGELLWRWVCSPATGTRAAAKSTPNMRKLRRASAVALFRTWYALGITERNVAAGLPMTPGSPRAVSAFDAKAIQRLKDYADHDSDTTTYESGYSRTPTCLALTLLGAQPGEVGAVRVRDVDLLNRTVRLHGGGTRYSERVVPIDDAWAWEALAARITYLSRRYPGDLDRLVAYNPRPGKPVTFASRSAATSMTLGKLITVAGLRKPGKTRVASINEYVAARIFAETGRVEAVAARLGMRGLDAAAHLVGWDWREQFNPDPTPGESS